MSDPKMKCSSKLESGICTVQFSFKVLILLLVALQVIFILSTLWNNIAAYGQTNNTNTSQLPNIQPSPRLHAVKISFPARGQQIPISDNNSLTISGESIAKPTSHCQISVLVNDIWPYQPATGSGPGGAADYSKWIFTLSPHYTTIKQGSNNKITARYTCSDNPSAVSFYSVNVTGVIPPASAVANQQSSSAAITGNSTTTTPTGVNITTAATSSQFPFTTTR
jgi:hypothetical protein